MIVAYNVDDIYAMMINDVKSPSKMSALCLVFDCRMLNISSKRGILMIPRDVALTGDFRWRICELFAQYLPFKN